MEFPKFSFCILSSQVQLAETLILSIKFTTYIHIIPMANPLYGVTSQTKITSVSFIFLFQFHCYLFAKIIGKLGGLY